jgi:microcystin-dependent protein
LLFGQSYASADSIYPALWAIVPAGWKSGTTLVLPDLADTSTIGVGPLGSLGSIAGSNTVTLTTAQLPSHNHPASGSTGADGTHNHPASASTATDGAHTHSYVFRSLGSSGTTGPTATVAVGPTQGGTTGPAGGHTHPVSVSTGPAGSHGHPVSVSVGNTGSGNTVPVVHRSVAIYYQIKH